MRKVSVVGSRMCYNYLPHKSMMPTTKKYPINRFISLKGGDAWEEAAHNLLVSVNLLNPISKSYGGVRKNV
jgi:hypothetical protein